MKSPLLIVFSFSLLCATLLPSSASLAIGVSAGTEISTEAEVSWSGHQVTVKSPVIFVGQIRGLMLTARNTAATLTAGSTFFSPHTVTNVGNGSEMIHLSLADTTDDFSSTLVCDDNGDGLHVNNETAAVPPDILLAEDACYNFFVALTSSLRATKNQKGKTIFKAACLAADGDAYVGADGRVYGGPDSVTSSVELTVSESWDTTPPTISEFLINKKSRVPKDAISASVEVDATITDNISDNIGLVVLVISWLGTSGIEGAGVEANGIQFFNKSTGHFRYVSPRPIPAGSYDFTLQAEDKSGNSTFESITPLYVNPSDRVEIIGPVVNCPNPFQPLKGVETSIAYNLTVDATITLYLFDIRGSAIWKRTYLAGYEGGMAGYNEVTFNGFSDFGEVLGNGVYLLRIVCNGKVIGNGRITVLD
jgi:hypothetical protein